MTLQDVLIAAALLLGIINWIRISLMAKRTKAMLLHAFKLIGEISEGMANTLEVYQKLFRDLKETIRSAAEKSESDNVN